MGSDRLVRIGSCQGTVTSTPARGMESSGVGLYYPAMATRWWLLPLSVWLLLLGITLNWWEFESAEEEHRILWLAVLFPVSALLVVKLASKGLGC